MKKTLLCIMFILVICVPVSSMEVENWISLGLSLDNFFESGTGIESMYMGSLGIDIGLYSFFNNGNIGLFLDIGFFTPVANSLESVYATETRPITEFGFMIGPGFRYNINEKMNLHFAAGFNLQFLNLNRVGSGAEKLYDIRTMFGLGGDAGFQYDFTEILHLSAGIKLIFNFANFITTESTEDDWKTAKIPNRGRVDGYSMFGIRPYVAIGFYSCGDINLKLGKPGI